LRLAAHSSTALSALATAYMGGVAAVVGERIFNRVKG